MTRKRQPRVISQNAWLLARLWSKFTHQHMDRVPFAALLL